MDSVDSKPNDPGDVFGRGIAFPPRLTGDGSVAWSSGPAHIREAITIILLTEPGERLMLPTFGAGLAAFLFQPNTTETRRLVQERIERSLRRWEPRVEIEQVAVDAAPDDAAVAIATIAYRLIANGQRDQIVLAVQLSASEGV